VLDADDGCKEVVQKLQALTARRDIAQPFSSTSAYCQARKKPGHDQLSSILPHTSESLQCLSDPQGLNGRRVIVVESTGVSMPDTIENQEVDLNPATKNLVVAFHRLAFALVFV